jgi:hypothetical protein
MDLIHLAPNGVHWLAVMNRVIILQVGDFFDLMSGYKLLKKVSAPWSLTTDMWHVPICSVDIYIYNKNWMGSETYFKIHLP